MDRLKEAAKEEAAAHASKRQRATNARSNVLEETGGRTIVDLGRLTGYQPTHAGSQEAYEGLLVSVGCVL